MPVNSTAAFEAFFNHTLRLKWDTLLSVTYVEGGGTHPRVGAISANEGRGWKLGLSMRTRFLVYDPPRHATAEMVEPTGPFGLWAASMRFRDREDGGSDLIYTYSIKLRPKWLGVLFDPIAGVIFAWETRRRFNAMSRFLQKQCIR
ncbi:MAG: hypothetical protein ACREU7_13765 [Burkholderiales bacterium]